MNKRFSKFGRNWQKAFCVVAVCGAVYSCTDEYELDDKAPGWLNSSIYEYLQTGNKYTDFVRLIDDLGMDTVLRKTGSKTLFVADNDAFTEFYRNNRWGVSNYDELTKAQKRLLFNSAMVNNSYLLEMMSSLSSSSEPLKGQCLRRETASAVTDSVPYFTSGDLPISYNPDDKDYWARFRNEDPDKGGLYLALDATTPMITHFLEAQLAAKNITNEDFRILMGKERQANDSYVYDSKVVEADIRCQNGYVNRLDKVLLVPQNMAEVLRTNGKTNIFSHMIERFSAPFFNKTLTERYKLLYGNAVDSVFEKRYFSIRSQGNLPLQNDAGTDPVSNPMGNDVNYGLNYDPGWNAYSMDSKTAKEMDMAVIFAPTDEKLYDYFFSQYGGGRFLLEAYAKTEMDLVQSQSDTENIYKAIDKIPLDVIQALINNLMKISFNAAVPSKFETIKNDTQDPMLDETHLKYIKGVEFANNGLIYLMDEVITPARYAAVSAPAYVADDMKIFKWAITRGSSENSGSLGATIPHFYAYLLAMSSRFSFFVPQDNNFWYIDPVSFKNPTSIAGTTELEGRAYFYEWDTKKSMPQCSQYKYIYDLATGQGYIGDQVPGSVSTLILGDRLRDMLETHTIVHTEEESVVGIECDKHYFVSKNGAPIYIEADKNNRREDMLVRAGWQVTSGSSCKVKRFDDKTKEKNGYGNGMAYQIDSPLLPTIESIYSVMYNNPDKYGKFFELCMTDGEVLDAIGLSANDQKRYNIFVNDGGLPCYDKKTGDVVEKATNVRFFSNYRYTLYVPTNAAIEKAHERGLPTWNDIRKVLKLDEEVSEEPEEGEKTDEELKKEEEEEEKRKEQATAMLTVLVNFIKYHFQDNSVFADVPVLADKAYTTATLNSETGVYCHVNVSSTGNGTLQVKGEANSEPCNVTDNKNIFTRDYLIGSNNVISASSFAVVHSIDGVLDYKNYEGGRYNSEWVTPAAAKKYLSKYRIIE